MACRGVGLLRRVGTGPANIIVRVPVRSTRRRNPMSDRDQINRRDFIVTTAGVAGGASALAGGTIAPAPAQTTPPLPSGIDEHSPLGQYWQKPVAELVGRVDLNAHVPELSNESVKERHRIYCFLL